MILSIDIQPASGDTQRIALAGRLDTHTWQQADEAFAPVLESGVSSLVLDLAGLEYISSAGVRSLFKARKAMAARGGRVLVANVQPQIRKVFDLVKAVPMGEIFSSVEEADAYLDTMQRKVLRGEAGEDG